MPKCCCGREIEENDDGEWIHINTSSDVCWPDVEEDPMNRYRAEPINYADDQVIEEYLS